MLTAPPIRPPQPPARPTAPFWRGSGGDATAVSPFRSTSAGPAGTVSLRAMRADDGERVLRMFDRLSGETRYRRFFSPMTKLDERTLSYLLDVDHDVREAIVAVVDDEVVAVAQYDRRPADPAIAEVAIVVEDAWQGRGVGRRLMRYLGAVAADRGVTCLLADVLPSNEAPVKLARAVAPLVQVSFEDGETHLVMPLPGTGPARAARRSASALVRRRVAPDEPTGPVPITA